MRIVNWLFGVWLVIITARYCSTVFRALKFPFREGTDSFWADAWLGAIAILILCYLLFRPVHVTRAGLLLLSTAACSMLILSQTIIPFVFACWIVVVTAGIGLQVLSRLLQSIDVSFEQLIVSVPLGFTMLSLAVFVLGWFHILTPVSVWTLLIAASVPAAIAIKGSHLTRPLSKAMTSESRILLAVMCLTTLLNLTWAVAPEVQYDALNYHLVVPKTYLASAGFVDFPFVHGYLARMIEYFLTICMAIGGEETSKLWIFLMEICATAGVFALGSALFNERVGLWAAAFFHTTPLVAWLSGTVYIDIVIAFLVTCTLIAIIRWAESRSAGWYYAACLLGAAAIGSKLNAAFAFVVLAPAMIRKSRTFVIGLLAFLVVALPSYAVVYSLTGNPVFPLFNEVFQSPKWDYENTTFNAAEFGLDRTLSNLIRLPFRLTLDTSRFGESLPRGALGVCLLLAFPFAGWFVLERRWIGALMVATAAAYLICFFYTAQYGRYYIPILPLIAVLGVGTVFHFGKGRMARLFTLCLWSLLLVQPLSTPLQFWNDPLRFPVTVAFGTESRDAFLRRTVDGYAAAMYLNKSVAPNETILGVGTEPVRFYLNPKLETLGISLRNSGVRRIADHAPNPELAAEMKVLGYQRIFTLRSELKKPEPWYPYLNADFLRHHTIVEFEDVAVVVYRLK